MPRPARSPIQPWPAGFRDSVALALRRAGARPSSAIALWMAVSFLAPTARAGAAAQEDPGDAPGAVAIPTRAELSELVAYAEPVAREPYAVRLESFRGDTINGVFLVDSDLPSARHVAFGKDARGFRYVWFSRQNPLRTNLVALYQVDGGDAPDILYWRHIDSADRITSAREFRAPAAAGLAFEYASGTPCGRSACDERWRELPLERIDVPAAFFEPLVSLFRFAAKHGESYLDAPVSSLPR